MCSFLIRESNCVILIWSFVSLDRPGNYLSKAEKNGVEVKSLRNVVDIKWSKKKKRYVVKALVLDEGSQSLK